MSEQDNQPHLLPPTLQFSVLASVIAAQVDHFRFLLGQLRNRQSEPSTHPSITRPSTHPSTYRRSTFLL